jgi:hypothetical protein
MLTNNWLYRDQSAAPITISQYVVSESVTEPAFVDCSKLRGGVLERCNLRYLILSNMGADLSPLNANAKKFGLVVLPRGLTWKILDKYTVGGKTQILLVPEKEADNHLIGQTIMAARKDFQELYDAPPVPNLNTNDWKDRLFFPVGLAEDGKPYPLAKNTNPR